MYRYKTSRFRIRHPGLGPTRWQRLQQQSGMVLLILSGLALTVVLYYAPRYFIQDRWSTDRQAFMEAHWSDFEAVERHWKTLPVVQRIHRGDEPEVIRFLADQPLVVAMLDRFESRQLWCREGNLLVPPRDLALAQQYLDWFSHAEGAQRFEWNPPRDQDPDFGKVATVVLLSDRWLVLKRWRPGSPEAERELAASLTPERRIRMGLIRETDVEREDLKEQPWGADPHLQADPARLANLLLSTNTKTNAFGDGWNLGGVGVEQDQKTYKKALRRQYRAYSAVAILVGLAIGLGMWLRYRSRKRAILDADRLASMTHSLKTPLAILKMRCDSLRLGSLGPEQMDAALISIGEDVDHLTLIIENSLRVVRGGAPSGPRGQATPAWFEALAEDLRPAFRQGARTLEVHLAPDAAEAPLPSLRAALFTLVENALGHGKGRVVLETWRQRRRFCIQISDEGEGLLPHQLKALGKPFQRLRETGKEGFLQEGQGLGLSLLVQVAQQEGWGLTFSSAPGEGFIALLEVPAA